MFHISPQLTDIKLQTQFFTTVTLVQFCVSKSPLCNVTSLIAVQLACNNTEVVINSHPQLIYSLSINRNLFTTQFEYHAKCIHRLFISSTHIALFNSNNLVSHFQQHFPSVQAVSQLTFLANLKTLQHECVYRHTILPSWIYNDTILHYLG